MSPAPGERLRRAVARAVPALARLDDAAAGLRPAPGKWSPKEVLGHLVDSASNNHSRFVLARSCEDLVFDGYDENAWVAAQDWNARPWTELVGLWRSFNEHLAHVMDATPARDRARPRPRHNLHEIAWAELPADEPATLDALQHDYVGHLEHHLRQIPGLGGDPG